MARKVFISVLGAGFYGECRYSDTSSGFMSSPTRFIQTATLDYINAGEWNENDVVVIALTDKAQTSNWNVKGNERKNVKDDKMEVYVGLETKLRQMNLASNILPLYIPDGKNEEEMWDIFQQIYDVMNDDDELYLDLTHSFRYLPMLLLVLCNYAKFLKNIKVKHISYGNYEARDITTGIAPMVNLLPLSVLQDWTIASADFLQNGYANRLVELSTNELKPILKAAKGSNKNASNMKNFVSEIEKIVLDRQTCRGLNVSSNDSVDKVRTLEGQITDTVLKQVRPVFDKIKESMDDEWKSNSAKNCLLTAEWCYDKDLYQQAITFLKESITSYVCEKMNYPQNDIRKREIADAAMSIVSKKYKNIESKWSKTASDNREITLEILNNGVLENDALINLHRSISETRNDFNHAGFRNNPMKAKDLIKKIEVYIGQIKDIWKDAGNADKNLPPLFLNLSNHPSEDWSKEQLAAAKEFGEIDDMKFPEIQPDADEAAIDALVEKNADEIIEKAETNKLTVHVMGEMVFVFKLINRLKEEGIRCVASTTDRIVEEKDGVKTSRFNFVRFREY